MDWDKAKTILIAMLILLNIFLGALTYLNTPRYSLTAEREKAILDVLAAAGIQWDARMPRQFAPLEDGS